MVFTTGFDRDEVFRIGRSSCTLPEFMVYLVNTQNQYENVYGEEIWNVESGGMTLEDNVKDTVLAKLAQIKTMYLMARERDVALDEEEQRQVEAAAETYFNSLTEHERQVIGVDREIIQQMYTQYAMAEKVYNQIIEGINPEISDDEARTITVEHILIRTYTTDGTGKRIDYPENMKRECYEQIIGIREQAVNGERILLSWRQNTVTTRICGILFARERSTPRWRRWRLTWKAERSARWWSWTAAII